MSLTVFFGGHRAPIVAMSSPGDCVGFYFVPEIRLEMTDRPFEQITI